MAKSLSTTLLLGEIAVHAGKLPNVIHITYVN